MVDSPERVLNRAVAQMLHDAGLAIYQPAGTIPERGIRIDGIYPTTLTEFTVITPLLPSSDPGYAADVTYRAQISTFRNASPLALHDWAAELRSVLHQKAYTPNVLGISWAEELSAHVFEPDTQGRASVSATYTFRGRRT